MNVLVTGAGGFIGGYLAPALARRGHVATGIARRTRAIAGYVEVLPGELERLDQWADALNGKQVVVHMAARAHVLSESGSPDQVLETFRRVNRDATLALADEAARRGVRRFVFISSIGVCGNLSGARAFDEVRTVEPVTPYAISKFEAEEGLRELAARTGMELVIIRPVLVYAADAPGNFALLLRLVRSRLPLPFARVDNKRSLLAVENLAEFIGTCVEHSAAAGECFVIADEAPISTHDMLKELSRGMGCKARLLPVPVVMLRLAASLLGRRKMYEQLCEDLWIDTSKAAQLLDWRPSQGIHEGLRRAGASYAKMENARH